MANMLFNINDVVETIQGHSITDDIIEEYDESQFEEEPKTLMDIPKIGKVQVLLLAIVF